MKWKNEKFLLQDTIVHGKVFQKSTPAKGTILSLQGLTSDVIDYLSFFNHFTEDFNVIALYHRGHGPNKEHFSANKLKHDFVEFTKQMPIDFYLGQSVGCSVDTDVPTYWLSPVFGTQYFSEVMQTLHDTSVKLQDTRMGKCIENSLGKTTMMKRLGFKNKRFISDMAEMKHVKPPRINNRLGYLIPSNDDIFGSSNVPIVRAYIKSLYPESIDHSDTMQDLNHCLNVKGFVPYAKDDGKRAAKLVRDFFLDK